MRRKLQWFYLCSSCELEYRRYLSIVDCFLVPKCRLSLGISRNNYHYPQLQKIAQAPPGEGCPRCGGRVYQAEEMLAMGKVSPDLIWRQVMVVVMRVMLVSPVAGWCRRWRGGNREEALDAGHHYVLPIYRGLRR